MVFHQKMLKLHRERSTTWTGFEPGTLQEVDACEWRLDRDREIEQNFYLEMIKQTFFKLKTLHQLYFSVDGMQKSAEKS